MRAECNKSGKFGIMVGQLQSDDMEVTMVRFLAILAVLFQFSELYAQQDIPHWDVERMRAAAPANGWTFEVRDSWVTEYLRTRRGRLENITGLLHSPDKLPQADKYDDLTPLPANEIPRKFDWRTYSKKGLQPIRNQASCGSCWAFSVTAVMEALIKLHFPNSNPDLAEQTLVSSCERGGSCSGGFFDAFDYIQNPGLPDEAQDPYRAANSSCKSGLTPKAKAVQWAYIGPSGGTASVPQMKTAILYYGPISVDVDGSFGSYSSGVYNNCRSSGTNHMVTIEGWDDDTESWIMRNSWGDWGMDGYMNIKWYGSSGKKCNNIGLYSAYAILDTQFIQSFAKKHNMTPEPFVFPAVRRD